MIAAIINLILPLNMESVSVNLDTWISMINALRKINMEKEMILKHLVPLQLISTKQKEDVSHVLKDASLVKMLITAKLVKKDSFTIIKHSFVSKSVEMEKDLYLDVMITIIEMEMDALEIVELNMGILALEDHLLRKTFALS